VKKPSQIATTGSATPKALGRVYLDIPPPCQQPGTSVEDLECPAHVPTRSPAECAQHMEECPNQWPCFPQEIRRRKYGKEGVGANMSILVSSEALSCHVHTGQFGPAMRRQYDLLHPKEPNKCPMHVPTRDSFVVRRALAHHPRATRTAWLRMASPIRVFGADLVVDLAERPALAC
jgi:hypothetical protein